jgi:hypothetical protein
MKCSVQQPFSPVVVQITLESAQELYLYQFLMASTITVPKAIFTGDSLRENQLREFMKSLHVKVSNL